MIVGYKPNKILRLVFDDPEMEGLEVRMRPIPLGKFLDFEPMWRDPERSDEQTTAMFQLFIDHVASWNVEDTDPDTNQDVPVPTTLEGLLSLDPRFVLRVVDEWAKVLAGVPAPLEPTSNGGTPSVELSLPMEPLSESPPS